MDTLKTFLLHVDDSDAATQHARVVQRLADRFDAHADALYSVLPSLSRFPASIALDGAWAAASQLAEFDEQQRALTKIRFVTTQKSLPRVHWCEVGPVSPWDFSRHAMYADLVVMRGGPAAQAELPADFAATVAIESGRPVLVLPTQTPTEIGSRVLLAWKPTREATRAIAAALPWLRQAAQVHVVTAETLDDSGPASVASLTRYLTAQGIECTRRAPLPDARDAGPALQALAAEIGADLVVMGCYGHNRTREWLLGGTTKSMTRDPSIPVLMAH
ncbi:universal stress protein [Piscinibacter gummiphilus]|uniref:Universal stress protein n=1 Tax=Piscinibacter gummiphilus TaxID=946333 RepID=A0ABZ0D0A7_9BURK|nr:universal stress protein [Piscinibacter gummiphilus]WOB10636.1 universal stress protein [Piscinibacter gummiphilus]